MSTMATLPERATLAAPRASAALASSRLPTFVACALLAAAVYVFVDVMVSLWMSCTIADGESSILSNVLIEYVLTGKWHYPVHAHHLFYPGMHVFMLHPPLHYWLASWWVRLAGVGPWQLAAQSMVTAIGMSLFVAGVCRRVYGVGTAAIMLCLAAAFYGMHFTAVSLRSDITFGACYTLLLFQLGRVWLTPVRGRSLTFHAAVMGMLCVACLAAHWNGFFVQLYLPVIVWRLIRREPGRWKSNLAALACGVVLALIPWWVLYDGDLPQALVFALLQGAHFMVLINVGWTLFLAPFLEWPGGRTVLFGGGLLLADKVVQVTVALWRRQSVRQALTGTLADRCDWFMLCNLAAYMAWWSTFVSNRHPQYVANFCFLLLPLSARGYARLVQRLVGLYRPAIAWRECIIATVGLALVVTGTQVKRTFTWNLAGLHNPQVVFDQTREALRSVVPDDRPVIVGGNAYPYLYDYDYRSTMLLSATPFLKPIEATGFVDILRHHFAQRGSLDAYGLTMEQRRRLVLDHGDVLVTTEAGHNWQNVYYPPEVWQKDYVEVATVFIHAPDVNCGIPAVHHAAWTRGPTYFTVYMRPELARRELERLASRVGHVDVREHVALLVYDPFGKPRPTMTADQWLELDDTGKAREVRAYFDGQDWFGAEFDAATRDELVRQLLPEVYKELLNWRAYGRSLAQGIDVALAETRLIRRWNQDPAR